MTSRCTRSPERDLRLLPKAQPHLHLTGAMRPATQDELAHRRGMHTVLPLPPTNSWADFQARYDAARDNVRNAADVIRMVREAAEDDAAGGCRWLEIQVDPTSYAPSFGGLRPMLDAVLAGAAEASVPTGVIVASSWTRSGAYALELAELAVEYAGAGVVGFGLSNDERAGRVADFTDAFRLAADAGLVTTPHSGFYTGPEHVRDCVELLGATRIGHGTAAAKDPATLALLAERGVALEICPTSYPPLGVHKLDEIPLRPLLDAGVPVVLGSDDPLLFGVDLVGQYGICRALGLTDDELAGIAADSVRHSAAPDELKRRLLSEVDEWLV